MAKLDPKELKMAMREAARMREANEDPYFLAGTILTQNFRIRQLEAVALAAEGLLENGVSADTLDKLQEALQLVRSSNKKAA
jgi:hypothetical protein